MPEVSEKPNRLTLVIENYTGASFALVGYDLIRGEHCSLPTSPIKPAIFPGHSSAEYTFIENPFAILYFAIHETDKAVLRVEFNCMKDAGNWVDVWKEALSKFLDVRHYLRQSDGGKHTRVLIQIKRYHPVKYGSNLHLFYSTD